MNTPPNAPELFESSVKESLYSCFRLFVCCCFLFSFVMFLLLLSVLFFCSLFYE